MRLKSEVGELITNEATIKAKVFIYFNNLYREESNKITQRVMECIPSIVTESMNQTLTAPISNEEVKEAVFEMGRLKALGPNGFPSVFFNLIGIL